MGTLGKLVGERGTEGGGRSRVGRPAGPMPLTCCDRAVCCAVLCAQAGRPSTALPSGTSSTAACASHTEGWSRVPTRMRSTPMAPSSSSLWTSERDRQGGWQTLHACVQGLVCAFLLLRGRGGLGGTGQVGGHWQAACRSVQVCVRGGVGVCSGCVTQGRYWDGTPGLRV